MTRIALIIFFTDFNKKKCRIFIAQIIHNLSEDSFDQRHQKFSFATNAKRPFLCF